MKNLILKKYEIQINPNTKPANGDVKWLNIEFRGNGMYLIEAKGRLGWDSIKKKHITSYQISAKSYNTSQGEKRHLQLKPEGNSTFIYEDGSEKSYKYKDGELIID